MKAHYLLFILFCLGISLLQCHQLKEDTLPNDTDANPFDTFDANVVVALANGKGIINLPGLFNNAIKSEEVEIIQSPNRGTVTTFDDNYLIYHPNPNESDFEDKVILKAKNGGSNNEEVEVRLIVRSSTPDYCLVENFNPTYLGTPLKYSVKKGEPLEVDFTALFCDFTRERSRGVFEHPHPTMSSEHLQIYLTPGKVTFKLEAPEDFVGSQGIIYEICLDYNGICEFNWFSCEDFPRACRYFLYTLVEVEVVE